MAKLSDTRLRALKPRAKSYQIADGGGLYVEVLPSGAVSFRYQYRIAGRKERAVLGTYPALQLARARRIHREYQTLVEQGISPARRIQEEKARERGADGNRFEAFARAWLAEWSQGKGASAVDHTRRWLEADVFPAIGRLQVQQVTPAHLLEIVDRIKARGAAQSARRVRGLLRQIFDHAINRLLIEANPADRIKASSIAPLNTRDRALTSEEIGAFLRALDLIECREQTRIALRLILLTLVRKRELLTARWEHLDLEEGVWSIPSTKNGKPHDVFLSKQALELFNRLRSLSAGSEFVLPHVSRLDQPMGDSTLNELLRRMLDRGVKGVSHFAVHDLRRTASTHLHEAGFNSDVIEKALNHTIGGVRGIYNRATYAEPRRVMLQQWADMVVAWSAEDSKVLTGRFGRAA